MNTGDYPILYLQILSSLCKTSHYKATNTDRAPISISYYIFITVIEFMKQHLCIKHFLHLKYNFVCQLINCNIHQSLFYL